MGEFIHFISNAEGSAAELDTQLQLSVDLGVVEASLASEVFGEIAEVKRVLNDLRRSLNSDGKWSVMSGTRIER